jgi:small subunit ribosomal protein S16
VAVKIKLMRLGKIRAPYYRIVVADSKTKRDGRAIETIGKYHPTQEPSLIEVDSERAQYWLGVGAQPTEPVAAILKVTGDWQKFRGEPGAEGTLRVREARTDKKTVLEAAAKESLGEMNDGATTPKKRAAGKKAAAAAADGTPSAARPTADEAAAAGDPRAAGTDSDNAAAAPAAPSDDAAAPAAPSDDAAKADVGTAQGAPAIEEITNVTSTETVKDEG